MQREHTYKIKRCFFRLISKIKRTARAPSIPIHYFAIQISGVRRAHESISIKFFVVLLIIEAVPSTSLLYLKMSSKANLPDDQTDWKKKE